MIPEVDDITVNLHEWFAVASIGVASIVLTASLFGLGRGVCCLVLGLIYYLGMAAIPTVGVALIADDVIRFATRPYAEAEWAPAPAHAALNSDDCQHATCLQFPMSESLARQALKQYSRCLVLAFIERDDSDMGMMDSFERTVINLLHNAPIRVTYYLTSHTFTGCGGNAITMTERGRGGLLCRESAFIQRYLISWIDSTTLASRANCMLQSKPLSMHHIAHCPCRNYNHSVAAHCVRAMSSCRATYADFDRYVVKESELYDHDATRVWDLLIALLSVLVGATATYPFYARGHVVWEEHWVVVIGLADALNADLCWWRATVIHALLVAVLVLCCWHGSASSFGVLPPPICYNVLAKLAAVELFRCGTQLVPPF